MNVRAWTIASIILASTALALVVIVIIIVSTRNTDNGDDSERIREVDRARRTPRFVDAIAKDGIKLDQPPSRIGDVDLTEGSVVYVSGQGNEAENGLYEVRGSNRWEPISSEAHPQMGEMLFLRNGSGAVLVGPDRRIVPPPRAVAPAHPATEGGTPRPGSAARRRVVVKDEDIVTESRTLRPSEVHGGVVICEKSIVLPDPETVRFDAVDEVCEFSIYNRHLTDPVEVGHTHKWTAKCENKFVEPSNGARFALRFKGDATGELYRV